MQKLLTVTIPSYNAEKTLPACLDSLTSDASLLDRLDILVVNDGSKDNTAGIAGSYAARFPESVRLINKENGGHGSGINTGIQEAKGKYFKVIDADDWILSENLESFLKLLETAQADVIFTNFHEVDLETGAAESWAMELPEGFYGKPWNFEELIRHFKEMERVLQFHGITYKTEFYRSLQYRLTEHVFYEDQEYSTYPLAHAGSFLPCDLFFYAYQVGNAEQSVSDQNRAKRLWMLKKVIDRLLEGYRKEFSEEKTEAGASAPFRKNLSTSQREYYRRKLEGLAIDYFMISCILNPNKKEGRQQASAFFEELKNRDPELAGSVRKQYLIFRAANTLRLSPAHYRQLLHSGLYQKLRGSN